MFISPLDVVPATGSPRLPTYRYPEDAARALGMRVLGLAMVTNALGEPVSHEEVVRVSNETAKAVGRLLVDLLPRIDGGPEVLLRLDERRRLLGQPPLGPVLTTADARGAGLPTQDITVTDTPAQSLALLSTTCVLTGPLTDTVTCNAASPANCNCGRQSANPGYAFTSLTAGTYTLTVTATDQAGNTSPSPGTTSYTLDATVPATPTVALVSGLSPGSDSSPQFSVTDPDVSPGGFTYSCVVTETSVTPNLTVAGSDVSCGTTTTVDLSSYGDGDYTVRVTVTDLNGVNKPSQPYRLRVVVHEDDNGHMTGYDLKYPDGGN